MKYFLNGYLIFFAFAHTLLLICILLHECFLNVGSVGQLQKATDLLVVSLSGTGQGQEPVCWPGNGLLAIRIRIALNKCRNFRWLLVFLMVNTFSWGWGGGIWLLYYHQVTKICLLFALAQFVVAVSLPLDIQNFTSTPPPTSSNQLHKYHKKCSPESFLSPPNTYGINYRLSKLCTRFWQPAFFF